MNLEMTMDVKIALGINLLANPSSVNVKIEN